MKKLALDLGSPPQAPSLAVWNALTLEERAAVVDALPCWMTDAELSPPEGDRHRIPTSVLGDTLREYFERLKRNVYIGSDLIVYYPHERRFAPDLFVVFDTQPGERDKWVVAHEGKGLDFALEVLYSGDRNKDLGTNVTFYAHLGIPEYFVYDRARQHIHGFRLTAPGRYAPILAQLGSYTSQSLGLDLAIEDGRLRFYHAEARLTEPQELRVRLQAAADQLTARLDEAQRARAEAEQAKTDAEQAKTDAEQAKTEAEQARADLEQRLAEALALIEQFKRHD